MSDNTRLVVSIMVAAVIIAGAIIISKRQATISTSQKQAPDGINIDVPKSDQEKIKKAIRPITDKDHIKGSKDAKIVVVEYSDFECPFCKRFHFTMNKLVNEYEGDVAWVYRHFPLDVLHPKNARKAALASECVASMAGNDAFWRFTDKYFEITPANDLNNLDKTLPELAKAAGVSYTELVKCVESKRFADKVEEDAQNAQATGGQGTPWNIIVTKDGRYLPLSGAMPYETMKKIIDKILGSM